MEQQAMPDNALSLQTRFANLSPEKQLLLERMKQRRSRARIETSSTISRSPITVPLAEISLEDQDPKVLCRQAYDTVSRQLDTGPFGEFSYFLNYGYVSDLGAEFAQVRVPDQYLNRNSVKLVLELIGDFRVAGRTILDIGCGRGAIPHVLTTFFEPARVIGLDLSPVAVAFCRRTHRDTRLRFLVGDAEELPFSANQFDAVTNLESSSCYPEVFSFYREVHRVLAPGGCFLYSDCLVPRRFDEAVKFLKEIGLRLEQDRDITSNVLLSCDQVACARIQAYGTTSAELENFLGAPGSQYYEDMQTGRMAYRILTFQKQ